MAESTGLEKFAKDLGTHEYWLRRLVAFLADVVLIWVALAIVGFRPFTTGLLDGPSLVGPALFVYSAAFEYLNGRTVGKAIMGLRVVGVGSKTDLSRLLIREVSKIFVLLLALDIAAGILLGKSGRQRYLEILSDTTEVVDRR